MDYSVTQKGRLPASVFSPVVLDELWEVLTQGGEFIWQAVVGTGDDLLGQKTERPIEVITDWGRLRELLASLPRIDSLQINAEFADRGSVSISFLNFVPPGGALVVAGHEAAWVEERYAALSDIFGKVKDEYATKLYRRWAFGVIQTVVPMSVAFIVVILAAIILIPGSIRQTEWVWWITVGTVLATFQVAYTVSNRLVRYFLMKNPYIRWLS